MPSWSGASLKGFAPPVWMDCADGRICPACRAQSGFSSKEGRFDLLLNPIVRNVPSTPATSRRVGGALKYSGNQTRKLVRPKVFLQGAVDEVPGANELVPPCAHE